MTCLCSADSLEEAPTEAGFHIDGHIEKVLSKLGDEQQQLRRYSRSFSEPNLAAHFLQAVESHLDHSTPPCQSHPCTPASCNARAQATSLNAAGNGHSSMPEAVHYVHNVRYPVHIRVMQFLAVLCQCTKSRGFSALQTLENGGENLLAADSSEEEEDNSQGIMTRLQSTVEATQVCHRILMHSLNGPCCRCMLGAHVAGWLHLSAEVSGLRAGCILSVVGGKDVRCCSSWQ